MKGAYERDGWPSWGGGQNDDFTFVADYTCILFFRDEKCHSLLIFSLIALLPPLDLNKFAFTVLCCTLSFVLVVIVVAVVIVELAVVAAVVKVVVVELAVVVVVAVFLYWT